MSTIFVGGSRRVSRLPPAAARRLDTIIARGHRVIVGDGKGADTAVQKHFRDARYRRITVFCSGATARSNLGAWPVRPVEAPKDATGFAFYAVKDREMAGDADFGLMIWDGHSPGTVLNLLRLASAGKPAVLFAGNDVVTIRSLAGWRDLVAQRGEQLRRDVRIRATPDEWRLIDPGHQPTFPSPFPSPFLAAAGTTGGLS